MADEDETLELNDEFGISEDKLLKYLVRENVKKRKIEASEGETIEDVLVSFDELTEKYSLPEIQFSGDEGEDKELEYMQATYKRHKMILAHEDLFINNPTAKKFILNATVSLWNTNFSLIENVLHGLRDL